MTYIYTLYLIYLLHGQIFNLSQSYLTEKHCEAVKSSILIELREIGATQVSAECKKE